VISELDSRSRGRGSSAGQGHCVVFLGKTLDSHSTPLHPGVQMGNGKFNAEVKPANDLHPILGGVEIFLVA